MDILVIEDDAMVQQLLQRGLLSEGHSPLVTGTGAEGLARLQHSRFDAIVLDLMLPDVDGFEVARRIREEGNSIPILMLTARDQLEDRLRGFSMGADDYLVKPFALRELLARLQAITRRAAPAPLQRRLAVGDIVLDQRAREVYRADEPVHLTPKEYAVLELLMENVGTVIAREAIMRRVWEYDFDGDSNVLETTIKRLRRAIDDGRTEALIHTARGVGYKVKPPARSSRTQASSNRG